MMRLNSTIDKLAAFVGMWALRRLYGANCETDYRDDHRDEKSGEIGFCYSCEAKRLIESMKDVAHDR